MLNKNLINYLEYCLEIRLNFLIKSNFYNNFISLINYVNFNNLENYNTKSNN